VRDHIEDYKISSKLRPKSGGSVEKLSKQQSEELECHLEKHTYLYIKDMMAYVQIEFGVTYTIPGLRNWLQRHGFSYKNQPLYLGRLIKSNKQNG